MYGSFFQTRFAARAISVYLPYVQYDGNCLAGKLLSGLGRGRSNSNGIFLCAGQTGIMRIVAVEMLTVQGKTRTTYLGNRQRFPLVPANSSVGSVECLPGRRWLYWEWEYEEHEPVQDKQILLNKRCPRAERASGPSE